MKQQLGFTLLLALVVIGLLLVIVFSVTMLSTRSLGLSSAYRQSQLAFYAADSGIECLLYYHEQGGEEKKFAQAPAAGPDEEDEEDEEGEEDQAYYEVGDELECGTVGLNVDEIEDKTIDGEAFMLTTFTQEMKLDNDSCAKLSVEGYADGEYILRSRGYDNCDDRSMERGLKVEFGG